MININTNNFNIIHIVDIDNLPKFVQYLKHLRNLQKIQKIFEQEHTKFPFFFFLIYPWIQNSSTNNSQHILSTKILAKYWITHTKKGGKASFRSLPSNNHPLNVVTRASSDKNSWGISDSFDNSRLYDIIWTSMRTNYLGQLHLIFNRNRARARINAYATMLGTWRERERERKGLVDGKCSIFN